VLLTLHPPRTVCRTYDRKGKDARLLAKFCRLFGRMEEGEPGLVLFMAQKMAKRKAV
jgi:hypothetical protein